MLPGRGLPLRRVLLGAGAVACAALLLVVAIVPLTGPLGGAAVAALLILGAIIGMLALSARDGCSVLTLLVVLLLLLPQDYVLVGPLKSVGSPAVLVAMAALAIWAASRILNLSEVAELHPVRWVLLAFTIAALMSYAAAMARDLTPAEQASADRVVFPLLGMLGVALLAVDALGGRERITRLLQRLVLVGGVAAFVGILEFAFSGFDFRELMRLPGLTANVDLVSDTRSGFDRVTAGASHPIEFSVVTAALVPLALHFCLHPAGGRRWRFVVALVALLVAVPMSVSRSGFLTLAVGLAVYAVALSRRGRFNALVLGLIGLGLFRAAVPGLLGTVRSLFLDVSTDPSIAGRTDDYQAIPALMQGHWWFGRGLGTFVPDVYFFLDNQYLASLLQGGVVGLVAFVALGVVGMGVARGVRHRSDDPALRSEGQAMAATLAALSFAALTYDALSFRQSAFLLFLVIGCAGAHWSLVRDRPKRTAAPAEVPAGGPVPART
ncbi:O-antigen polymerase [Nocardioides sp. CF8]|uniref:O-antigen ligase family protein n=1 Tax=Nocardioides sp. CF8 TaxID=110319 RepID=UPI00032E3E4D|nr:O-antigen ligase family protein [Nocardioides sp. CF8]EON22944.1 O-antigen polymerase [Nocardioides sp. CF8]